MSKIDILLIPPICEVCDKEIDHQSINHNHICTYCEEELIHAVHNNDFR